jgi:prostaglandin-endoperoxide synthase 2
MAKTRDKSRDGFKNRLEAYALAHFKPLWDFLQSNEGLKKAVNKKLINNAIYKLPTRPFPFSTMAPYTSWDSLTDHTYSALHLEPVEKLPENLPAVEDLAVLFRKIGGKTKYSHKSTVLFPYFVQWFTDGFLRTDRNNQLKNTSNHQIDLCPLYGLNSSITKMLRSHQGGKLKSQFINGEEYPPYFYDENGQVKEEFKDMPHVRGEGESSMWDKTPLEQRNKVFAMGIEIERANVQIGYVMLNTLFLREHNRLCDLLAQNYPNWDDERLFQTARNIIIVLLMRIVIEEYINHITPYHFKFSTDPLAFSNEKWYRPNWMPFEFALVYRWHSALPDTLMYDGKPMHMGRTMWNNDLITDKGLGALFEESSSQPAGMIDLFNTPDFLVPVELASIRMGREAKLRSYNDYRVMCGFPRVTDFNQITADETAQEKLKHLYGNVDNIDFYVGLFAEDQAWENSTVPPMIARIVAIDAFSQALTNPLLAEGIFNEKTFSPVGWEVIHTTSTLTEIVHRNIPQTDRKFKVTFDLKPREV